MAKEKITVNLRNYEQIVGKFSEFYSDFPFPLENYTLGDVMALQEFLNPKENAEERQTLF